MPPFSEIGMFDLLDIVVMTAFVYTVLVWFKKTRAAFVLIGILMVAGFYLLARQFNLILTASVFQAFFAVILVAVVVIFQEELRHFFERVAVLGLPKHFGRKKLVPVSHPEVVVLVRTLTDFAKERIGALIVLRGKDMIMRHLEGGEELQGVLSVALLKSLFDPHSPGHDGAAVLEENTVAQFACHLPLSKNFRVIGEGGTRHAAALGLSELSDALCLVVSEERGTISYARHGELRELDDPVALSQLLEAFYREMHPKAEPKRWQDFFRKDLREKIFALLIAVILWFLHVYGSKTVYRSYVVPVQYTGLPDTLKVREINPREVTVTFSGPRRAFYFLSRKKIELLLKTRVAKEGENNVRISNSDLTVPKNFSIENIRPRRVRFKITKRIP